MAESAALTSPASAPRAAVGAPLDLDLSAPAPMQGEVWAAGRGRTRSTPAPDLPLPYEPAVVAVSKPAALQPLVMPADAGRPAFDPDSTLHFQAKMTKAPEWFCSFLAGNTREKRRLRDELAHMKGAWPLLMKQRNGGKWTPEEKVELQGMVKSASSVSPYLFIWAVPGSMLLLPFLAWFLDRQRKKALKRLSQR